MYPVADPVAGWGGEKHEIYAATFGGHLFSDFFLQGWEGHGPLAPPDLLLASVNQLIFFQAEVAEVDLHRFRGMPSVISDGSTDGLATDNKSDFGCFALPPIKYPNGKYRMQWRI